MAVKFKVEPLVQAEGFTMFGLIPSTSDALALDGTFVEKSDNVAAGIGVTHDGRFYVPDGTVSFYAYFKTGPGAGYKGTLTMSGITSEGVEITFNVDR